MANKLLIVGAVAMLTVGGYAAGGGSFESGETKGDPARCRMLMRSFIDELRQEDARSPSRQLTADS